MNKKIYVPPAMVVEDLRADTNVAGACGTTLPSSTLSCLQTVQPDDYFMLTEFMGLAPSMSLNDPRYTENVYSGNECLISCYQGPIDTFFSS